MIAATSFMYFCAVRADRRGADTPWQHYAARCSQCSFYATEFRRVFAPRNQPFGGFARKLHGRSHRFGASAREACIDREQDLTRGGRLLMLRISTRPGIAMDPKIIDDLARRLAGAVPESLNALKRDLETNFKSVLQSGLARLDLVTRDEFDVQAGVLRRTREKLEALEARIKELEAEGQK
jgi:hypothetical protein